MKYIQKISIVLFLSLVLIFNGVQVYADDIQPTPPPQPSAPTEPTPPTEPTKPTPPPAPDNNTQDTTPTSTPTPTQSADAATSQNSANDPTTTNNGSSSSSTTASSNNTNTSSQQNNTGASQAAVNESSITGHNSSSDNVGSATVSTQNANASGTVINGVNTNLNNVSVSEFNVADNHTGDIILDFPANCVFNCTSLPTINTTNNGTASSNATTLNQNNTSATGQQNNVAVGNTLKLTADSGNNATSQNTSGDSAITTGNANIDANSLAFANNNLDGQVVFGVVNIYGNLDGDIILPQSSLDAVCGGSCGTGTITTANNGSNSNNTTNASDNSSNNSNQDNNAGIVNTIKTNATTGNNSTAENTTGDNGIDTGTSAVNANSLTLANNNLDGGVWWLVLINDHGNWSGKLIGGDGNVASSNGLSFSLTPSGDIATNGNGADSQNTTTVTDNTNNSTGQTNNAAIHNTLDLSASTGGNHADQNTGGNSTVKTGNANILANLVDFVNNNLTHGAKLIVTIVNVFGSWTGNFVAPGQQKQSHIAQNTSQTSTSQTQPVSLTASNTASTADPLPLLTPGAVNNASSSWGGQKTVFAVADANHVPTFQVASMHYPDNTTSPQAARELQINLAWLVLLLPGLAVLNLVRKRIMTDR